LLYFLWRNISVPFPFVCVGTAEEPPNYHKERGKRREKSVEGIQLIFKESCPTDIYIS
jgi:hypothetical protein